MDSLASPTNFVYDCFLVESIEPARRLSTHTCKSYKTKRARKHLKKKTLKKSYIQSKRIRHRYLMNDRYS